MIETPASALAAERLAEHVDFFSIGTNDLTQYTMAADREHPDLAALSDALHPPVLDLIQHVAAVGSAYEVPVSVCGELAADVQAVPVLVGLGVHRLSVAPPAVPPVKAAVRHFSVADAEALADAALADPDAAAVRRRTERFWQEHAPDFVP
jgi:phosphoenolpyruvate-protein kinase (PTS system EI component)